MSLSSNLFSVEGKMTLITRSTQGLGLAFAQGYAEAVAKVVINGRNPETVASVTESFRQKGMSTFGRIYTYLTVRF